jgi:hypothetical protein
MVSPMYLKSSLALSLALAALGGCSSSSSPDRLDGSVKKDGSADSGHDAGIDVKHYADGDCFGGGCSVDAPVFTAAAGAKWTDLYRDYFGPSGVASCAGTVGNCHGGTSDHGYAASGFLCTSGDQSGCYASLTSTADGGPDLIEPDASFNDDSLSQVLCQCNGAGSMPYGCCYIFSATDLERIQDWIAAGAQND